MPKEQSHIFPTTQRARVMQMVGIPIIVDRQFFYIIAFCHHPTMAIIAANPRVLFVLRYIRPSVYFAAHGARVFLAPLHAAVVAEGFAVGTLAPLAVCTAAGLARTAAACVAWGNSYRRGVADSSGSEGRMTKQN